MQPAKFITALLTATLMVLASSACVQSQGVAPAGGGASDAVTKGGEFRINMTSEPDTIDPGRSNFSQSILVASQVFDGLLAYDKDLKLVPLVAKEVPSLTNSGISQDGRTYTFRLRDDVKWSDGKPVTAKDFVYAIKRSLDPKLAAPYASTLYDIEGAQAYNTALGTKDAPKQTSDSDLGALREKVGVSAPDTTTLVVRLSAPRPSFLQLSALWVAWPVREDIINQYGDKWTEPPNYIGNGPFVLTKWSHGDRLELAPNPNYYGRKPNLDKLVLVEITDANQAFLAYQNGELDATAVPDANTQLVLKDPTLSKESLRYNELVVFGYQFNNKTAPFDNPKVRQALALAVDREALIEKVLQGIGKVAYSPIPPGMPGYDAEVGKEYVFNVTKAKQLLTEAGYADVSKLPKITFTFSDNSSNRLRAEFFQAQMKQNLGIDMTLEPLDARAYTSRYNTGQFMMVLGGWGADYPDPDNFVPELFKTGSGNNKNSYSNAQVDALAKACQSETTESKRLDACAQAQKLVTADQPWIFLNYRERFWLVKPNVKGFQVTAKDQLPGNRFYNNVWIQR